MARCLVGCGSNLGNRREQLDRAVELLRFMPGISLVAVSRFRETRPVGGPVGQPPYLNGACVLDTDLGPRELLEALFAVEQTLHRDRAERWAARTIDLDLLLYDGVSMDTVDLTLPHPRMVTRRFVLEPCVDVAADWIHPAAGCSLRALLDNICVPHPLVAVVGVPGSGAPEIAAAVADATLARPLPAPAPQPTDARAPSWHEAARAWSQPLLSPHWEHTEQATVADYWIGALPISAAWHLDREALADFEVEVARLATMTVVPAVAIVVVAEPDLLEERIAASGSSRGGAAVCAAPALGPAAMSELQDRLVRRLRCPGDRAEWTPRAVVTVDAGDQERAVAEVTAAVEAML